MTTKSKWRRTPAASQAMETQNAPQQVTQLPPPPQTTPPPQQQHPPPPLFTSTPRPMAATPSSSAQNSAQQTPSVISISSSSPYQCSSGLGQEIYSGGATSDQQPVHNSYFATPTSRGRGSTFQQHPQYLVIQQHQETPTPSPPPSGSGRGGRKIATPRRGGGAGGSRKTPHTPSVQEAPAVVENGKQDDEVQIVVDKGANSGRRGGARSQRLESYLSNGSDMALEDQRRADRELKTRENERKRRQSQKESADLLRSLVPGCSDGKNRKVGEGIVMQKSAEYIQKLHEELHEFRQGSEVLRLKKMLHDAYRTTAGNLVKYHRLMMILSFYHKKALERVVPRPIPAFNPEELKPTMHTLPREIQEVVARQVKEMRDKVAGKMRAQAQQTPGTPEGVATPQQETTLTVQNPNASFIPLATSSQGGTPQQVLLAALPHQSRVRIHPGIQILSNPVNQAMKMQQQQAGKVVPPQMRFQRFLDSPRQIGNFGGTPVRVGGNVIAVRQQNGQLIRMSAVGGQRSEVVVKAPVFKRVFGQQNVLQQDAGIREQMSLINLKEEAGEPTVANIKEERVSDEDMAEEEESESVDLESVKREVMEEEEGFSVANVKREEVVDIDREPLVSVHEIKNEVDEEEPTVNVVDVQHDNHVEPVSVADIKQEVVDEEAGAGPAASEMENGTLEFGPRLPGWTVDGMGEYVPSSDEDDDDDPQRPGGGIRVENGGQFGGHRMPREPTFETEHQALFAMVEHNMSFEDHDRIFRSDPLFKHDFLWHGYHDDPKIGAGIRDVVALSWDQVQRERAEKDRMEKEMLELKRTKRDDDYDENGKKKRGGGRGKGGGGRGNNAGRGRGGGSARGGARRR